MAEAGTRILEKMLERLYAGLANGPLMNCRPHASRQRIDLTELGKLDGPAPAELLSDLLGAARSGKYVLRREGAAEGAQGIWSKLRAIAEDARIYEQDTGVQALYVGYPLLHVPPSSPKGGSRFGVKRLIAPIAFVPVQLALKATRPQSFTIEATGDGDELVTPNTALLSWVQRVTGKKIAELDGDAPAQAPLRAIRELVKAVCGALEISEQFSAAGEDAALELGATPRAEDDDGQRAGVVPAAVLGLFPATNQGLLRDLEALIAGEPIQEPLSSFLKAGSELGVAPAGANGAARADVVAVERCVSPADPCQLRAVRLARSSSGLVIHGPPGTGKSQTIANIVADHLANGERVLFVCDKRTALDVVHYRLQHLELGGLCAVVHDARRDPRELYRAVRDQLDILPEARTNPRAKAELEALDRELEALHDELARYTRAVGDRPQNGTEPSFHELVGRWFSIAAPEHAGAVHEIPGVRLEQIPTFERAAREILERGRAIAYPSNPWTYFADADLASFLGRPNAEVRRALADVAERARRVEQLTDPHLPLDPNADLASQAAGLRELAVALEQVAARGSGPELARWAAVDPGGLAHARASFASVEPLASQLAAEPLDHQLLPAFAQPPNLPELTSFLGRLASYLQIARTWYGFLFFGRRREALRLLERFGLSISADAAERVKTFLERLRGRVQLQAWLSAVRPAPPRLLGDHELGAAVAEYAAIFRVLWLVDADPRVQHLRDRLRSWMVDPANHRNLTAGLARAADRAEATSGLRAALHDLRLLRADKQAALVWAACAGQPVYAEVAALEQRQESLEHVLRIRQLLATAPSGVASALERLLELGAPEHAGWAALERALLSGVISARLAAEPLLLSADAQRLRTSYDQYRLLEDRRRTLARDVVLHTFVARQRERLLASTGSRLNTLGADVRRRLVSRGERAMRLRQVIQAGANIEGGDPLFDLRPVWMASPEVVAQLLPRAPVFDVVIFDEASQCRLEETLPVLTRGRRVVIAGDPKQLPPTRFFESAVLESQEAEAKGDQELFEERQVESEDLLTAALNLSIEQAYLDVHYRSINADLIEFSNDHFYDSRLQAVPAHPQNFVTLPPLRLIHARGIYDKRANQEEARQVLAIVRELLAQPEPPSIGVACFNLTQRDCIVETLEDAALEDPEFGARLAAARTRRGAASFEGLFVKNLENVQGDERDHLIVSTTYGPDARGKFYRRFGPLGQAGGGRRLNVLVTRARQQVHIVTSIPPAEYRGEVAVPDGKQPNGGLLLFRYLNYAERIERAYAEANARRDAPGELRAPECRVSGSASPSPLAVALGEHVKGRFGIGSHIHWGNDGFCVDAALQHPFRAEHVTIGVLCDGTRFTRAPDPVQWDVFRFAVLEQQGWKLVRLWSPQFFRDPEGALRTVRDEVEKVLSAEKPDARAVTAPMAKALN